jgi:hypothetical protein
MLYAARISYFVVMMIVVPDFESTFLNRWLPSTISFIFMVIEVAQVSNNGCIASTFISLRIRKCCTRLPSSSGEHGDTTFTETSNDVPPNPTSSDSQIGRYIVYGYV